MTPIAKILKFHHHFAGQNLSTEKAADRRCLRRVAREIQGQAEPVKAMVLGFVVLDVAGEENLRAMMQDQEQYLLSIRP